jgi:hypothetical protein
LHEIEKQKIEKKTEEREKKLKLIKLKKERKKEGFLKIINASTSLI